MSIFVHSVKSLPAVKEAPTEVPVSNEAPVETEAESQERVNSHINIFAGTVLPSIIISIDLNNHI